MSTTTFVKSFTYLKGKPKSDQALPLLQRLASLVKPIMRKYNWSLPVLAEFFPRNDNLLGMNVNRGQKILIRLRPASSPDTFYEDEDLIGTMLHELTHNVHGPHDSKFYEFLAKLEQEYYDLKRSGYAGEGFFSEGKKVGAGVGHNVPMHVARQKALEAAEKRRRTATMLGGSGEKLGGKSAANTKSLRQLAAEAAERRAQDEKACGTTHQEDNEKEISNAAENSATAIIDVDEISTPSTSQIKKRPRSPSPTSDKVSSKKVSTSLSNHNRLAGPSGMVEQRMESPKDAWICRTCTLINEPLALQCSVCLSTRPQDLNPTWICLNCGEDGTAQQFWTCKKCGELRVEV